MLTKIRQPMLMVECELNNEKTTHAHKGKTTHADGNNVKHKKTAYAHK